MKLRHLTAAVPALILVACLLAGHVDRCPATSRSYGRCALAKGHRPAVGRPEGWHVNRTGQGWRGVRLVDVEADAG